MDKMQTETEGTVGKRVKATFNPVFTTAELREMANTISSLLIYNDGISTYKPSIGANAKENLYKLTKMWSSLQGDISLSKGKAPMVAKVGTEAKKRIQKAKAAISKIAKKQKVEAPTEPVVLSQEEISNMFEALQPKELMDDEIPF